MLVLIQAYERLTMTNSIPLTTTSLPQRLDRRPSGLLWGGLGLILSGAGLLLTSGQFRGDNWWAIFILLPALASLASAWLALHFGGGAFNLGARLGLGTGLPTLAVALIFMYHINWSIGWTLMLMVAGLVILINGFTVPGLPLGSRRRAAAELVWWIGLSVIALGATFLLDRLGVIHLAEQFGAAHWWSAFILLPGVGALLSALNASRAHGQSGGAQLLAGCGLLLIAAAAGDYAGLAWRWYGPMLLILGGLVVVWQAIPRDGH